MNMDILFGFSVLFIFGSMGLAVLVDSQMGK